MGQPQDGCLIDNHPSTSCSSSSTSTFLTISHKSLLKAEEIAQHILTRIQPTEDSELTRNAVSNYFQFLLRVRLGIQVYPFGSGPLKTYLPDGDIDLTALSSEDVEDVAKDVLAVLQREQHNTTGVLIVKDMQYIRADVKLIKCLVRSTVVDISFNQHGGICTLGFLEEIDRMIGQDHLFKRSIILTKAWCYYESRILGAHHGLLSTYALETMILYIFQVFTVKGPLEVLYRFLDYFSKFNWDKYCISLNGPVFLSSLPQIVVDKPETDGVPLLVSKEHLKFYMERISRGKIGPESNPRIFLKKHLNIMDPLKENNNLGRSVSQANFFRMRSAFSHGARTLGRILLLPETNIPREIANFFKNTASRIAGGQMIHVPIQSYDNTHGAPLPFFYGPQGLPFHPCADAHQVSKLCRRTFFPSKMVDSMLWNDDYNREKKLVSGRRSNPKAVNQHGHLQHCASVRVVPLCDARSPKGNKSLQDHMLCEKTSHHETSEQRPTRCPKSGSHDEISSNNHLQRSTDQTMVLCKTKFRKKTSHHQTTLQGDIASCQRRFPKENSHMRSHDSEVKKTPSLDSTIEIERAAGPTYDLPDVNQFPPLSANRSQTYIL